MKTINWKPKFLICMLSVQAAVILAIVADIPFVRQVLVSLYLIFVPGFVILKVLRLETSNMAETVLFSIGLSIAFVMLMGLLLNSSGIIQQPLSTEPILMFTSFYVLLLSFLSCFNKREISLSFPHGLKISHIMPYLALPLLSVIGILLVRTFNNNLLLLSTIVVISIMLVLTSFSKFPASHYPFVLVSIAAALLLMTFLTSNYINGFDTHWEYMVFTATKNNSYWNPSFGITTGLAWMYIHVSNSMLASTLLPTVLSNMAKIDGTWIFNIINPLIYSLVPLALYQLFQTQWEKKVAFFSVLFFISHEVFFNFRNNSRGTLAEFFYVLMFLVLFKKNMDERSKFVFFGFFSFALIVSYYALNYGFLFLILATWFSVRVFSKNKTRKIRSELVAFSIISTFIWYIYVTGGPFDRFIHFVEVTLRHTLSEFFVLESRGQQVVSALNVTGAPTYLHQFGRFFFYASILFILIGFITLIAKRNKEIDVEFSTLISLNMFVLSLAVIVPQFAYGMQMTKLYNITLLFLSPLFILGGITLFKNALRMFHMKNGKRETNGLILILVVLVPFFLFQTGFIYEVARDSDPTSVALSGYRMDDASLLCFNLINENDFFGATWLSKYTSTSSRTIYSDEAAMPNGLLVALMDIDFSTRTLSNETVITESSSYIFLTHYNTKYEIIINERTLAREIIINRSKYPNVAYDFAEIPILNTSNVYCNKIYANGACNIHHYGVPQLKR